MSLKIKTTVYTEAGVVAFPGIYREIVSAILSNSPNPFTPLPISEAALQDSVTAMEDTTDAANRGGEVEKTARRDQHEICVNILNQLAAFVLQIASMKPTYEQKVEVVQLSKFTLVKQHHEPTPPLSQITGVVAKWTGIQGQALVEWNRIESGAPSYNVYFSLTAPGPDANWQYAGATRRKRFVLNSLPHLGQVWVQVVATGKDDEASVPSVPVEVTIESIPT